MTTPSSARAQLARRKLQRALFLRTVLQWSLQRIADSTLPCDVHVPDGRPDCDLCVTPMYSSRGAVSKVITKALAEEFPLDAEAKEQAKREQLATIREAVRKMITDVLNGKDAADRARASNALERLLGRQAKLLGLDAPARVVVTEELDMAIDQELAALLEQQPTGPSDLS